jgi:hypothetical protein
MCDISRNSSQDEKCFRKKKVAEVFKAHILCSMTFFRLSCHLSDNVEKYDTARQVTDDNIVRHMRFACWMTKATYTLIICNTCSFPLQQCCHERASALRLYVHCLSCLKYELHHQIKQHFDYKFKFW